MLCKCKWRNYRTGSEGTKTMLDKQQHAGMQTSSGIAHSREYSCNPPEKRPVEAIILAAGRGSRLCSITAKLPKCLVEVGNRCLIEHQLNMLANAGIDQVTVVGGYCADQVKAQLRGRAELIFNPVWSQTNSLFSLWLCRERVRSPFVVMNCDVLAHPEILQRLLDRGGPAFTYDASSGADEEHMKVEIEAGALRAMSKSLPAHRSDGENIGILYFDEPVGQNLFREAEKALEVGGRNMWMAAAVERVAKKHDLAAIDVANLPWIEIDYPEDLQEARQVIWPELCARPRKIFHDQEMAENGKSTAVEAQAL